MNSDNLVRLLAFRELALRFLDSFTPRLDKEIIIADAICSFSGIEELDAKVPLRHHAHAFVLEAMAVIENGQRSLSGGRFRRWMVCWNNEFGPG